MLKRTTLRVFQVGVHVPHGTHYFGAKMKHWPTSKIPQNFNLTTEQKLKMEPLPRDVGTIPRNFVLNVLYQHQPCEVEKIWEMVCEDSTTVLDSRKHLRAVLKQCREEGFIYFDRDAVTDGWICHLTRERFEEVKEIAKTTAQNATPASINVLRGSAVSETTASGEAFQNLTLEEQDQHLKQLEEAVAATNESVRYLQRTEVEYLPYTDLNGKVNFMWWYDVRDASSDQTFAQSLQMPQPDPALPAPDKILKGTKPEGV